MLFKTALIALLPAAGVFAKTFKVIVGKGDALTYEPSSISGLVKGDSIAFQFASKNHTVTQSTFANPCTDIATPNPVNSGFLSVPAGSTQNPEWSITINQLNGPLFFFCAQKPHCAKGMVFAVNPTATESFAAFQANAKKTDAGGGAAPPAAGAGASKPGAAITTPGAPAAPGGATKPAAPPAAPGGAAKPAVPGAPATPSASGAPATPSASGAPATPPAGTPPAPPAAPAGAAPTGPKRRSLNAPLALRRRGVKLFMKDM